MTSPTGTSWAIAIRTRLGGPGAVLFIGMNIANASNYLFQVVMSRGLGPGDYSLLGGVLAVVTVLGVSLSALQTASAKAVAGNRGDHPALRFDPLTRATVRYGLAASVLIALLSPVLGSFLHTGVGPGIAVATFLVPAGLLAIGQGRLQGGEAFTALAVLAVGLAGARIVFSALAIALHLGVTAVVMVTVLVSLAGGLVALHLTRHCAPSRLDAVRGDVARASAALLLFWIMVSIDIPVARHFLTRPDMAGQYAAASVVGKAVLWLPAALSVMMFPRVTSRRRHGMAPHPPLVRAFVLAAVLGLLAELLLFFWGPWAIPLFFGSGYAEGGRIAWQVGAACLPFALVNILIYYHLTRERNTFIVGLGIGLVAEIAALAVLHDSATEIVVAMGVSGFAVLLALGVPGTMRRMGRRRTDHPRRYEAISSRQAE